MSSKKTRFFIFGAEMVNAVSENKSVEGKDGGLFVWDGVDGVELALAFNGWGKMMEIMQEEYEELSKKIPHVSSL